MTAPATIINVPPGPASTWSVEMMRMQTDPVVKAIAPGGKLVWHLGGGKAPIPGAEPGMVLQKISGLMAPPKLIDLQGARQDGVTNTDLVYDPAEVDMWLQANAPLNPRTLLPDPDGMRRIIRWWMESWAGNRQLKLSYATPEMGEWWMPVRQLKPVVEQFAVSYAQTGEQQLQWGARGDDSFWFSFDSASEVTLPAGMTSISDWLYLSNRGTQGGWPRFLCYGPGSFDLADGISGKTVSFGPLLNGQVVLITTLPRLRSVIDLTPSNVVIPSQQLSFWQKLLQDLIEFATNNNTPPLLQMFESWAGIRPPQGQLYGLMNGRFSSPIPAQEEGQPPTNVRLSVTIRPGQITTANYQGILGLGNLIPQPNSIVHPLPGTSRVVAALTPTRIWPE